MPNYCRSSGRNGATRRADQSFGGMLSSVIESLNKEGVGNTSLGIYMLSKTGLLVLDSRIVRVDSGVVDCDELIIGGVDWSDVVERVISYGGGVD